MNRKHIYIIGVAMASFLAQPCLADKKPSYKTKTGIIICHENEKVRALEPFTGSPIGGTWYSDAINHYRDTLDSHVRIYSMVIPTSAGLYCPEDAKEWVHDEEPVIDNIYHHLTKGVEVVNVYPKLRQHIYEDIYSRTDHHWSPLGAYYAAQEFAKVAQVKVPDLKDFDERVVNDFVGSMYHYSKDLAVKNSPEKFIYYVPKDSSYTTTFVGHNMGKNRTVVSLTEPFTGSFFIKYKDGSSSAYCTFMGGDLRTTHVQTHVQNGRRLMIIKDSYGNALPGYLMGSFEDIYVVDFRYFTKNIVQYVKDNGITDILFANNLQHAYAKSTARGIVSMLHK